MKILVTGGCGFLGTNLCLHYLSQGHQVVAYDNLTKFELSRNPLLRPEAREYGRDVVESRGGVIAVADVRDQEALMSWAQGCDYICHTAAQPAMTLSRLDPETDFSTNVAGTFHVLETARALGIPAAVCSSIHTYGPDKINAEIVEGETRYTRIPPNIGEEESLLNGCVTPLHASKRCAEIYTRCFIETFGVKAACFRLTGIYGPCQLGGEDHGWVANFAIRMMTGKPIHLFGNGKQARDILFAADAVSAFDAFFRHPVPGVYTIGGGEKNLISLLECISLLEEITGRKAKLRFERQREADLKYFSADYSRFEKASGWKPGTLPREGITSLVDWIGDNARLFASSA